MIRVRSALAVLAFAGLFSPACSTTRTVAPQAIAPIADSPVAAVQRLAWAFNHHDLGILVGLLTGDAVFSSASADSAGNVAPDEPWTRAELLLALRSMFDGVPGLSQPASVRLTLESDLVAGPDDRPGRDSQAHHSVGSGFELVVVDPTSRTRFAVSGFLDFFTTRADSAVIPVDQALRGARADASRWWIDRLQDESVGVGGLEPNPANRTTLASVLAFYRDRLGP